MYEFQIIFRRPETSILNYKSDRCWSFFLVDVIRKNTSSFGYEHVRIPYEKTMNLHHRNEFWFDCSTFSQHGVLENKAKQQFHNFFVRRFYVFATWCAGKQRKTTIARNFRSTVLRSCNIKTVSVRKLVLRFRNTDVRKPEQNNDFKTFLFDSSTFLQHWCPENTVQRRFHEIFVRQFFFCCFATLMSRKHCKTTVSRNFRSTVLRFCDTDVRKTL